jgi:hypothetical protein
MLIDGFIFDYASNIDLRRTPDGNPVLETPHLRYANLKNLPLNPYGLGPFSRLILQKLPLKPGVYTIVNDTNQILYIGKTRDSISERWSTRGYAVIHPRNCFVGGQETNCRINNLIVQTVSSRIRLGLYAHVTDRSKVDEIETTLITRLRPPWNRLQVCSPSIVPVTCPIGQ